MRVFEFIINPDDLEMGMKAISLVDKPAIESEFIAFNKQEKPKFVRFQDEKKYIVAGLALIPDKLIYRVDETGEEYLGYFSAETIEMIADKFMKESTMGTLKDVNLQHNSDDKVQAHLMESFILRTEEMVNAVKAMGIEEAVLGSWFVSYKFDSKEDYDKAVSGEFTGFSIEILLQRELKMSKNNNKIKKDVMTKLKSFIDKFKTILAEVESQLEDVEVPETGKSLRIGELGQPVVWVSVDEAGVEMLEPALAGEYILVDNRIVVVDENGNLAEIKEAGTEPAPIPEEELKEEKPVEVPAAEVAPTGVTEQPMVDVSAKTLGEIVDVTKDGMYSIEVTVAGGQITAATVEAEQDLIGEQLNAKETEITALKAEIESLKEQLSKPVSKPAFVEFNQYTPKEDMSKLNNLERTLKRLKIQ